MASSDRAPIEPGAPADDPLFDPHRVAAARRLMLEVPGPAAFDRLSALAARLLDAGHAKVTIFTDHDVVVGGYGLPPGVVGGPALLTGALSAITVRQRRSLDVPDARADERVASLPAVTSGQVGAYLGAPVISASGHAVGALAVYDPVPRVWSDDAAALLEQLAVSVAAELELSATQSAVGTSLARLEIALEASSIGIWERDLRTGTMTWDRRCAAIFGSDDGGEQLDFDQALLDRIHPDDHDAVRAAMQGAIDEQGQYTVEARAVRRDRSVRWIVSRGRVVGNSRGEPVRILGTIVDLTDARQQAEERISAVQRAAALAEVAAELGNAARMDQLAEIVLRGAQVLGAEASLLAVFEPGGGPLRLHMTSRLFRSIEPHLTEPVPAEGLEIALDDSQPTQYAARHGRRVLLGNRQEMLALFPATAPALEVLGDIHAIAALPLRVEGQVLGSFVAVWDTPHPFGGDDVEVLEALAAQIALTVSRLQADAERAAAVEAMAEANRRLRLLAEVGSVLSGSMEIDQQIGQLADLLVPELGDWCWIVVTDDSGRLYGIASGHRDPARREEVASYVRGMVAVMTEDAAARAVIRSGRPMVLPTIDWGDVERALPDLGVREALARLGSASGTVVPLVARGHVMGALGLFNREERGPLSGAEVDTAVEVGRRTGLALHHARLYGQQRDLADALQRSMLTAPPKPRHSEIVVRYVPAAEGAEIGGDWYDAFEQPGDVTVLAIGDVVGHDTRAAAAMGQVRGLLRGISYATGASPSAVLTELDRAVQGLALDTMATALVAHVEPQQGTDDLLLRWSNAGHPPPVLIGPEGSVRLLDGRQADLLLGVAPESIREDRTVELTPGSTVFLYTDGLVERRDRDIDAGTEQLMAVLGEIAGLPLDELCDGVLERLFLPDAEDDVAVLAVRINPPPLR